MKIINNRIIPEYVADKDLNIIEFKNLDSATRKLVFQHSQHVSFLNNRPYMRRKLEETETILKLDNGFTGSEFTKVVEWATNKGLVVQYDVQRIHGGAQGARNPGKIEIGKSQVILDILKELGMLEAYYNLPMAKRMDRIHKVFGPQEEFKVKPVVKVGTDTNYKLEGLIFAHPDYMEMCGIPYGAKTTLATKGQIVPAQLKGCDILVPMNENKWSLSAEQLANTMRWRPDQSPEYAFSKNLRRWPTARFDLLSILDMIPGKDFKINLDDIKAIYEYGEPNIKEIYNLFGYQDSSGKTVLRDEGIRVLIGESIYSKDIWPAAERSLMTMVLNEVQPKIQGFYGVAMPMELLPEGCHTYKVWLTRYPWTEYIKTTVGVYEHCIFVDEDLMVQIFGGDFDRDQIACIYEDEIDNGLEWPRDEKKIRELFQQPEKEDDKSSSDTDEYRVIAYQLDQYSGCGIAYNNSKIVLEIARVAGYSREAIRDMDIILSSKIVQPFIDGFKYVGQDKKPPTVYEMLKLLKVNYKGTSIKKYSDMFRIWRSRSTSLDDIIMLASISNPESRSFYEKISTIFKGWKKGNTLESSPIKEIDDQVKASYVNHMDKEDVQQARYDELIVKGSTFEYINEVLTSCWSRKDVGLARCIINNMRELIDYDAIFEKKEELT